MVDRKGGDRSHYNGFIKIENQPIKRLCIMVQNLHNLNQFHKAFIYHQFLIIYLFLKRNWTSY